MVRRDSVPVEVDASDVVVGDLLLLGAGDRIPADAVLVRADSLEVDTSTLTGDSEPQLLESGSDVFAGTFVVEDEVEAEVRATGIVTRLAGIARLTTLTERPDSPLTLELHRVVRTMATIAAGVGGAFFVLAVLLGTPASDGFVFAVGVTVALVPEGLLPTVTLSLAWGAEQMARRRAGAPPRCGGDIGFHHLHLHRQDRNAHPQPDGRGRGVDRRQYGDDPRQRL